MKIAAGVLEAQLLGVAFLVQASRVERYRREHLSKPGPKPKEL